MQNRHTAREAYFAEQEVTTERYVIPFIETCRPITEGTTVLEIGCGEGGNLKPFLDRGCRCVGVDLACNKIENGRRFFDGHPRNDQIELICRDVFELDGRTFDVVFMRDVLEHIHDQERFMADVKKFLKPESRFFLGFPPWHNPFGGHQQICKNRLLSTLPYFHLLPGPLYRGVLRLAGETPATIESLLEIRDTGITIERFRRIVRREGYRTERETFYFINPNYEVKFGMRPREHWRLLSAIPYLRNLTVTTNYYVLSFSG